MKIEIDENIWCSEELGVLDKTIIVESIRSNLKEANDELFGHMILFTRCRPDNVTRSINKLIDLKYLTGSRFKERKSEKEEPSAEPIKETVEDKNKYLDDFLKRYKQVIKDKYFEIAEKDSIIISEDAMKLTISCFKNNNKRYESYSTISDNNLIAIFEVAVKIKKNEQGYNNIKNPFAYLNNIINKSIKQIS